MKNIIKQAVGGLAALDEIADALIALLQISAFLRAGCSFRGGYSPLIGERCRER